MKKRLLALALCLVMMTSLLPVTAAADTVVFSSLVLKGSEVLPDDNGGTFYTYYVELDGENYTFLKNDGTEYTDIESFFISELSTDPEDYNLLTTPPEDGETYYLFIGVFFNRLSDQPNDIISDNFSANLVIPGYITKLYSADSYFSSVNGQNLNKQTLRLVFSLTKGHEHDWRFNVSQNGDTLTAQCQHQGCGKEVSVTLKADPVTLPNSPFETAELVGWNEFQRVTGAGKSDFVYRFKGPGDESFGTAFEGDSSKIKAGLYQVGVTINKNGNTAFLFTQYTAADPAVTAQTGDSRPIEIMMASVLVFSALAAAAFILDNKRRSLP